jgi:D-alanyl-lipoteichoic acid acyltransferase DltB (MBOAT superfamily)
MFHGIVPSNIAWGLIQGGAIFIYMAWRNKFRKWAKSIGNPTWIAFLCWALTFNLAALSEVLSLHDSLHWCFGATRRIFEGPIWPSIASAVAWPRTLVALAFAIAFHSLPRRMGGDLWPKSLRPLNRLAAAAAIVLIVLLSDWRSSLP